MWCSVLVPFSDAAQFPSLQGLSAGLDDVMAASSALYYQLACPDDLVGPHFVD